eukprot:g71434.t1
MSGSGQHCGRSQGVLSASMMMMMMMMMMMLEDDDDDDDEDEDDEDDDDEDEDEDDDKDNDDDYDDEDEDEDDDDDDDDDDDVGICLNVNSYNVPKLSEAGKKVYEKTKTAPSGEGFAHRVRRPEAEYNITDLLKALSKVDPEMRIRFTSPHPKDFPEELLHFMRRTPNVCSQLHVPLQSGSDKVLEAMKRGYSRKAYISLIERIRSILGPEVRISTDLIAGFCGETEEDHLQTLDMLRRVKYDMAFMFAYSTRDKTYAARHLTDDVPEAVKQRRLSEIITTFREELVAKMAWEVGRSHLVLVDGQASRSKPAENGDPCMQLRGRTDGNLKVHFAAVPVPGTEDEAVVVPQAGEYVEVRVDRARNSTLLATPLRRTSLLAWARRFPEYRDHFAQFPTATSQDHHVPSHLEGKLQTDAP